MSYESGKPSTVKRRDPYQEVFDANEILISKMRTDMAKIAKKWFNCNVDSLPEFLDVFLFHCPQYRNFKAEYGIEPIKIQADMLNCNGWE